MSSRPEQLKSTRSYIWYTGHVLGTGATSKVYIGRHKKTGEQVAVKTFISASFSRPREVRELNVIQKIKHKNIVDLLAIEDDQITKQPVIIMELCMGGSLYSILEEPQNIFGLKEDEFLIVLRDVTSGMKYLQETKIVHRDLKPGNIMRVVAEDNTSIYKLADFGAARELQDGGEFMSLYGTEEYLHPDLYQRAVLKVASHGRYSAKIDLWSVGVTFYHVATGQLPFRPYGGRKNRETMIYLTTKKPNGVISGVQYDSPTGKIVWSSQLPETCHLPSALKKHILQLLAGLLECNIQRMWSFDEFFTNVQDILNFKKVHVFNAVTSQAVNIYISPRSDVWNQFTAKVEEETHISAAQQLLCFKEQILDSNTLSMEIKDYLETSPQNPIILLRKDLKKFPPPIPPPRPKLPKMPTTYNLENDAPLAKVCCGAMYYYLTVVMALLQMQDQMGLTVKLFCGVLKGKIREVEGNVKEAKTHKVYIEETLNWLQQRAVLQKDELMHMQQEYKQEIKDPLHRIFGEFEVFFRRIIHDRVLETAYDDKQKCQPQEHCYGRFEVLVKETKTISDQFTEDKRSKRLTYNEEQIHKMDKQKLSIKCTQGISLLTEHCELKWREQHNRLGSWYTRAYFDFQSVAILTQKIKDSIRKFTIFKRRLEEKKDALYLRGLEPSYARAEMSPTAHQTSHKRLMRDYDHEGVSNLKYSRQLVQEPPGKQTTSLMTNANQHHIGHPQQGTLVAGSSGSQSRSQGFESHTAHLACVFQQRSLYMSVPVTWYNPNTPPSTMQPMPVQQIRMTTPVENGFLDRQINVQQVTWYNPNAPSSIMQPMPMQQIPMVAPVENRFPDRQINVQQVTWYNPNAPPSTMQPMPLPSMPMAAPVENRFLDRQMNAQQVSSYNPNAPPSTMQPMPMQSMPVAVPMENRFVDRQILQSEVGAKTGRRINAQQVSSHAPSRMPTTVPGEFPNRRINEHDLNTFAGNMGADWRSFMRNLGLKENEIFHASCGCCTERDKIFACLVKWRKRQAHNATVREFVRMCIHNEIDVDTYEFLSN